MPERRLTQPGGRFSTPSYTARVGHWSEQLEEQAAREIGLAPGEGRERLRAMLEVVGREVDLLAGRTFGRNERTTVTIAAQPLPFAEIPDLDPDSMEADGEAWAVADPVNRQMATVLQLGRIEAPPGQSIPIADALWVAGHFVADLSRAGRLTRDWVFWWLANELEPGRLKEVLRTVFDQNTRFHVPLGATGYGGWWFQVARRLFWVTKDTPDDGRLLEPLQDLDKDAKAPMILAAGEPVLIVARVTSHPTDWAMSARIWTEVTRPTDRPWRVMADAIHHVGIPILTTDGEWSPEELGSQLVLLAYWHGYLGKDEPGLVGALLQAYPRPVARIQRATGVDVQSAAAMLLEGLLRPGFDPARGAQASRRYVARKASIAVLNHRKAEMYPHPWEFLGVSERYYYKLLRRFAPRIGGRYEVDDEVMARIRTYLSAEDLRRDSAAPRQMAMEVLEGRGFKRAAARKWLQRHRLEDAIDAWPRRSGAH